MTNKYCWRCGIQLPPQGARCPQCRRLARLDTSAIFVLAAVPATAAAGWNVYEGVGPAWAMLAGVAVFICAFLFLTLASSMKFTTRPTSETWGRELGAMYLLGVAVAAAIWPLVALENKFRPMDFLLAFVAGPSALSVAYLGMRFLGYRGGLPLCRRCGSPISTRNRYCGTCGRPTGW